MRVRGEAVCVAVGVALCTLLAAWIPGAAEGLFLAPGARGLEALRLVEHLRAWAAGRAALGAEVGGPVSLAGWPVAAPAVALAAVGVPTGVAIALVTRAMLGAWAGVLWGLARGRGHGPGHAALVCGVGVGPWAVAQARDGALAFLGGGFFLVAACATSSRRAWARPLALGCLALAAGMDAGIGAVGALALAVAGGGSPGWRVSLVAAAALFAVHGTWAVTGSVDGFDLVAPFGGRPGAVAPGLAALLAAALVLPARDDAAVLPRCAWGAVAAWVLSLGAMLRLAGAPALVAGHAIPLPGVLVAVCAGGADAGAGAVVVAAVLVAVGLAGVASHPSGAAAEPIAASPRATAYALGAVVLAEGVWSATAASWAGVPAPAGPAVTVLAERVGGLVVLPWAGYGAEGSPRAQWLARATGRPLHRATAAQDLLHAEPAVAVALAVSSGDATVRVPPLPAGAAFTRLGVTDLVVDRTELSDAALARLDPVLARLHGAPQRDHAAGLDVYRVPEVSAAVAPVPIVRGAAASDAEGWRTLAELLGTR